MVGSKEKGDSNCIESPISTIEDHNKSIFDIICT